MSDRALLALVLVSVIGIVGTLLSRQLHEEAVAGAAAVSAETAGTARTTQVKAVITACDRCGPNRIEAVGRITNTGNADLHFVNLKVLWLNSAGLLIESSTVYALNDAVLAPGESRVFTDVTSRVAAARCNVEAVDWW